MRRRRARVAPPTDAPAYTPGSWGASAIPDLPSVLMPPPEQVVTVIPSAPPPPPAPVSEAPPPLVTPPLPTPTPSPTAPAAAPSDEAEPGAGVRLGFADGTDLHLDQADPYTIALKAVADVLVQKGPHREGASE